MPVTQLCVFERDGRSRVGAWREEGVYDLSAMLGWESMDDVLCLSVARIGAALRGVSWMEHTSFGLGGVTLKAPLDSQEVWAAGVTYLRSREARMEETHTPDIYDRVYEAERPELFLKATPSRTVGPGEPVGIRADSSWDAAEPELVLAINSRMEVVGFAAGNDMSSRSIEGENPLYLPQAKIYDRCFALGPAITLVWELPDVHDLTIRMTIHRDGGPVFEGETSTRLLKRTFPELVRCLGRHNSFPRGVLLSTGTGIVPPDDFSLQAGDVVEIEIEQIGALVNPVVRLD
ncbi:MAG TPA: fumarylacetoacetate hydrolase family protein [Chloroflexota bacterium]|jgi:2-dehydro-3-deoxy-D-arabinonate dehydratase